MVSQKLYFDKHLVSDSCKLGVEGIDVDESEKWCQITFLWGISTNNLQLLPGTVQFI